MNPQLHEALTRAVAAEAANAVLTAQVTHLTTLLAVAQENLQEARNDAQEARDESREHVTFMRRFMVAMASTIIERMASVQATNRNQNIDISEALDANHQINGSRTIRAALQPNVMFSKKRLEDGINTIVKCTRGQERYVERVRSEIVEDGYEVIAKVPVGNAISMGQHIAAQATLRLAPGVRNIFSAR